MRPRRAGRPVEEDVSNEAARRGAAESLHVSHLDAKFIRIICTLVVKSAKTISGLAGRVNLDVSRPSELRLHGRVGLDVSRPSELRLHGRVGAVRVDHS